MKLTHSAARDALLLTAATIVLVACCFAVGWFYSQWAGLA